MGVASPLSSTPLLGYGAGSVFFKRKHEIQSLTTFVACLKTQMSCGPIRIYVLGSWTHSLLCNKAHFLQGGPWSTQPGFPGPVGVWDAPPTHLSCPWLWTSWSLQALISSTCAPRRGHNDKKEASLPRACLCQPGFLSQVRVQLQCPFKPGNLVASCLC